MPFVFSLAYRYLFDRDNFPRRGIVIFGFSPRILPKTELFAVRTAGKKYLIKGAYYSSIREQRSSMLLTERIVLVL